MAITLSQQVTPPALFTHEKCSMTSCIPYVLPTKHIFPSHIYLLSLSFQSTIRSKFSQRHLDMVPDNLITFRVLGKEEIRLQI